MGAEFYLSTCTYFVVLELVEAIIISTVVVNGLINLINIQVYVALFMCG